MSTAQAIIAVDQNRKWRQSRALSGSCTISALMAFDRKWQSHVTEVCSAHARFFPRFCLSSTVVTWLPDVTEGHLIPSGFPWVCATGSCATPVVTPSEVSLGCSLRRPRLIFSMVTGTKHLRPILSMVTGTSPGYLPLLFSYSFYIGCVVLLLC